MTTDARIGYVANTIWRTFNPGDVKTPPADEAAEYRAAAAAVLDMLDEAATAAVKVEHPATVEDLEKVELQRQARAAEQDIRDLNIENTALLERVDYLDRLVEQLTRAADAAREQLAKAEGDAKSQWKAADELCAANLEVETQQQGITALLDRAAEQPPESGKPRVHIRWLIPRGHHDTTVEYGIRRPHHLRVEPCSTAAAEIAAAGADEVLCRQVTDWVPAKPLVTAAAHSNGHAAPADAGPPTSPGPDQPAAPVDVEAAFRKARARLAGTAKMRSDDPRRVAAQVGFAEAKAARDGAR